MTTTLAANMDEDAETFERFEEYRQKKGMTSKSEAVRTLIREGLERELDDYGDDVQRNQNDAVQTEPSPDLIRKNAPILFGLAFLIASDGFLSALEAAAGETIGTLVFVAGGMIIVASLFPMFARHVQNLAGAGTDDSDASSDQRAAGGAD